MLYLEHFIIYIIIVLFPILIYLFYVAYRKILKEKEKSLYLEIALFSSLCFSIYLLNIKVVQFCFFLTIIPLLLSYLYKKSYISIIMSIILCEFLSKLYNLPIYLIIIGFILYYILYLIYTKYNKSRLFFTNGFYVVSILIMSVYLFIFLKIIDITIISEFIINTVLFYFVVFIINLLISKGDEILNLYNTMQDFENEKQIKVSLFKITHEIKNPISVVKGYLDMFDVNDKDKSIRYVSIINQEINRTLNLLNDFMQFTKISLEKEEMDFNILLDDVKQIVKPLFENKNIKYKFKTEEDIFVYADYNRLKQVVLNLIKNGIEACRNNGIILITTYKDEEKLYIIIKDNGMGMTREELNKIHTPFYTTKENGTGLGVCLSKEIIEAHKGKLNYSSIKNKETIAKIVLPLSKS